MMNKQQWVKNYTHAISTMKTFQSNVGKKVTKKSKPFKSGSKTATVKGITLNQITGNLAYTFFEDDSIVDCEKCKLKEVRN